MNAVRRFCFLVMLVTAASAFAQQDFSADLASPTSTNTFPTKIFVTRGRLRFQQQDRAGRSNSIMLVNLTKMTSVVLMPQQHLYVKQTRPQIPGQGAAFFQPSDVRDACALWQKMVELKGRCRNLGNDVVNGRETLKYENVEPDEKASYVWIEPKLHFPVKWQSALGIKELRNIVVAPQPADLFEIPDGYSKRTFDTKPAKSSH